MPDYMTVDHVEKKKQKKGDTSFSENASYSEQMKLEGSAKKKKKKHRSTDDESFMDISSLDSLSPSYSHRSFVKYEEQEDTSEQVSNRDCDSNTPKESNKKKQKEMSLEETLEEADSKEALLNESVRKKKKKHRSPEMRSLEEDDLADIQQSLKKSKKKKQREMSVDETLDSVGETLEETRHTGQTSLHVGHGHSDEVTAYEEPRLSESVIKKKKKHRPLETRSLVEDDLEEIQQSPKKSKKKKQREVPVEETLEEADHTRQPSLHDGHSHFDEVAVSEETFLSSSVRKKKRHRPPETRSLEEDDLEATQQSPKKSKKKKQREVSMGESLEKADHTGQLSLHNGHSDEVTVSEETLLNESARKKNHRPPETRSQEEDVLEDIQQSVKKSKKKKRKEVSLEETLEEADHTGQPSLRDGHSDEVTFISEEALLSDSVRKKMHEPPETRNLEEDVLEHIQQTSSLITRKKEKNRHQSKEDHTQTESSICYKYFKKDTSPEPISNNVAATEESEDEEIVKNLDASEETFENITEATNTKTDDGGTLSKTNKSAQRNKSKGKRDQDVTTDLDTSDKDEMQTALDEETNDPKKDECKGPKPIKQSANEVLSSLRNRDLSLLEEYFPNIRSKAGKTIRDLLACELKRIKEAKKKGIKFETGRFDSTEDEMIKKNVEEFLKLIGIDSGEMLFHSYRFPEKRKTIEQLKKTYHYRQRIAKGLARTITEVYNRGSKLYDLSGKRGRFSKEEVKKLQKGISKHGNDWTTVGRLIGRSNKIAQLKASQLRREVTGGKWSSEELNRLIQAVKQFILISLKRKNRKKFSISEPKTVPKEMLFTRIPWSKVEAKVKTRNWAHCKSKWNDFLLLRMNGGISPYEGVLGFQNNIDIIKWLHEAKLIKGQVKWSEMAKDIGNIPPGILQQKVYKLKSRNVPRWRSLSFKEIVDCLYTECLPKLEAKMNAVLVSQDPVDMPEKKDEFLISDIFQEYSENNYLSKPICSSDESSSEDS
ncbi:transcription termination factor 1 [Mantella aurantiaca]